LLSRRRIKQVARFRDAELMDEFVQRLIARVRHFRAQREYPLWMAAGAEGMIRIRAAQPSAA